MSAVGRQDLQKYLQDTVWGVCPFDTLKDYLLPVRSRERLPANAKSILVFAFPYLLEEEIYTDARLSRFAVPADYHILCGEVLQQCCEQLAQGFPDHTFVHFADASPIPEVSAAVAAGLGAVGKNGLLLTEKYGSWVFLGEIVTDLDVQCEVSAHRVCIGCNKCMQACPTGALSADGFRLEKCLSHISQKKKLTEEEIKILKKNNTLWGCDRCQTACPYNANARTTFMERFRATARTMLTRDDPERVYMWRGDAIFRNLELLEE
ncbi:MAG: DUF1730 domain-containing protein [Clostridia bacterium]|nr:DUF1730 domain-containing protein [Clostridia bacterium]